MRKLFLQAFTSCLAMAAATVNAQTATDTAFPKQVNIFGVKIYATQSVTDNKVLHAASVMAEYLDNNEDGMIDDPAVVNAMIAANAFLFMANNESGEAAISDSLPPGEGQNLFGFETLP